MEKENNDIFSIGKFDRNDPLHLVLGLFLAYVIYCVLKDFVPRLAQFDIAYIDPALPYKWIALFGVIAASFFWDFRQMEISRAKICVKDIFVSSVLWFVLCLIC